MRFVGILICVVLCTKLVGQDFDERFDLWPVDLKINGTVIAAGGVNLPARAIDLFVEIAKKESSAVVICLGDAQIPERMANIANLQRIVFDLEEIDSITTGDLGNISGAKAVCLVAKRKIAKDPKTLFDALKNVVDGGGLVCSNGPMSEWMGRIAFDDVSDVANYNFSTIQSAANLVADSVICTQYSDRTDRNSLLAVLAANPKCVGIGIPETSAIVLNQRKIRVIGKEKASFYLMANEVKPLRVQHVGEAKSRRTSPYDSIVDLTAWRRDAIERTVDPFPPAAPPKPFVKKGSLVIVGGGAMPRGLMEEMVAMAGGAKANMVYIPCSERESVGTRHSIVETWKQMGVESATYIHTKNRNQANHDQEFLNPLKDATGLWFGGGRQWNFSDSYFGTEAHRLMKKVLDRGGVIGGSSAGASIQARYLARANPVANFDIMAAGYERGLGFIGGVAIDQHFSQRGRQKDMTQLVNRYPQLLGIGIDEATALIVKESEAKIVGRGKVYFYNRRQPVIPGSEDFTAVSAGETYDLVERKLIER